MSNKKELTPEEKKERDLSDCETLKKLVDREVLHCISVLMGEIHELDYDTQLDTFGYSIDEIENLYTDSEDEDGEPEIQEIFEYWAVTEWFHEKLKEAGAPVFELADFHVWGRCTTGQMICQDGIIREIARKMEILTGQENDWSKFKK